MAPLYMIHEIDNQCGRKNEGIDAKNIFISYMTFDFHPPCKSLASNVGIAERCARACATVSSAVQFLKVQPFTNRAHCTIS